MSGNNDNLILGVTTAMVVFNAIYTNVDYDLNKGTITSFKNTMHLGNNGLIVGAGLMAKHTDNLGFLWLNSLILITIPLRVLTGIV